VQVVWGLPVGKALFGGTATLIEWDGPYAQMCERQRMKSGIMPVPGYGPPWEMIVTRRIEFLGGASDLEQRVCAPNGFGGVNQQMDLKKIMRRLSGRSYRILLRRRDGIDWKSISEELGISRQTAQNSFWREIRQAQLDLLKIDGEKEISPIKHSLDGGKGKAMKKSPHSASRSARRGHRTGTD